MGKVEGCEFVRILKMMRESFIHFRGSYYEVPAFFYFLCFLIGVGMVLD